MDLYQEINQKMHDMDTCVRLLRVSGAEFAKAEHDYKVRLRAECLQLKREGMPVTLIQLVVYGVEEVAELRERRDYAEAVYRANLEALQACKLAIKVLQNQLNIEMSNPNLGYGSM